MRHLIRLCLAAATAAVAMSLAFPAAAVFSSDGRSPAFAASAVNPGALSFSAPAFTTGEAGGSATFTLKRTGGADTEVVAKVSLTDVTTSASDYRLTPGALDATFNASTSTVWTTTLQPDGKLIVGGRFASVNGTAREGVARLKADGSLDASFDANWFGDTQPVTVFTTALQPDGKVIIGGAFRASDDATHVSIARVNADGSLDASFAPSTDLNGTVNTTALQPDGKVIVGGDFQTLNGVARKGIARLNSDGSLDATFDPGTGFGVSGNVLTTALQPDGKVLVGGIFTSFNGTARNGVARLKSDGSLDATFNPVNVAGTTNIVRTVKALPGGKVLVGGNLSFVNGAPNVALVRLNSDGSLDNTFDADTTAGSGVFASALQPDGKIVVGGAFSIDGWPGSNVARLNTDGSNDASFNPGTGTDDSVWALALQPDGKVIIGGDFTLVDGTPRGHIARLEGDPFFTWAAGDSSDKTFSLPIVDDSLAEANESLTLTLTPLAGGASAGTYQTATLTILDNDASVSSVSGSGVYKGTATLTATLTLGGSPLAGRTVSFTMNGNPAGSAATNAAGVATLSGVSLSGVNAGTYAGAVAASFAGEAGVSGGSGSGALTVSKASQTIAFGALGPRHFGDADFTVSATASSGLPVSFSASGKCTVSGSTVHLTGAGACTITASQAGDSNYNAAPDVAQSFSISKADTTTTVTSTPNPSALGQSVTFTATVTSPAGTPTGTVQFEIDGTNVGSPAALNASGVATFTTSTLSVASHGVIAEYGGDSNFNASTGVLSPGQEVGSFLAFSQASYTVAEGGSLTVTVFRTGDTSQPVSVDYTTGVARPAPRVVPCSLTTGFALDRCDYTAALGTLHFAAGEGEKSFTVSINDDSYVEGPEVALLLLSNPSSGSVLVQHGVAEFTITDDSPERTSNPIDDTSAFIRQHYLDFLNREPDAPGFLFWRNNIESCGADAQCREVKRIDTSAAFFLSIEFQETGFLVYRAYKVAYGDATSDGVAGTVPVIHLNEFLTDTQRIGQGLVVGQGAWQQQLETNKQAYFAEFVARARFAAAFPTTQTPSQFADALFNNAGVTPTAAQRQAAIDEFAGASDTSNQAARGRALRRVAENSALAQAETNRAFVLMEYYGYLRRNPSDVPEPTLNFAGWKFWLDKLNQFGGDYRRAEMVKAFLSSDEYRNRFGQ